MELRSRSLSDTLKLAVAAGRAAGVTRVSDVTQFGVRGIPVFQATRPASRSFTVSQGKGLTPTAAIVGALLETTEFWRAETLARPGDVRPLAELSTDDIAIWSGARDALAIDLSPSLSRAWLTGTNLSTGASCAMPWDLLSLDFTDGNLDFIATSNGLATGNTRTEALASGIAELLEHHFVARFHRLRPSERRAMQVSLATVEDSVIRRLLTYVERAGLEVRAWSLASDFAVPVFEVTLFDMQACADDITPVSGNGCYPDARIAFIRALLEAVQGLATLVAGARDDLTPDEYRDRQERNIGILLNTLAFDDGPHDWRSIPTIECTSSEQCLDRLAEQVSRITSVPLVAFDHLPPCPGLHIAHVLAPGLLDEFRGPRVEPQAPVAQSALVANGIRQPLSSRKILFAGPSIAGQVIPPGIELRPPAQCGDLADLLSDPPVAVGLVDGYFRGAPTVWHKEILNLLAQGVQVLGGGSIGALRATELERFGMTGVGTLYDAYRSGALVRDDAVMLVHAPAELGFAPLSVPLVDAEYALFGFDLPPKTLRIMQRIVRTTPYETRDWPSCLAQYQLRTGQAFPVSLRDLEAAPSLKQIDTALLVKALSECQPRKPLEMAVPPLTSHYRAMLARSAPAFAAGLI
ncbi:YcaO-like family protein [Croceibacterium sp. LX-88]|uniref:YcaO-like family protein n=1 Tax=Croceibacterium selenioxidans TaxID=2838833 RepID=A0ABS5W6V9_9SPHN|nr:YcaO-like family protein [Croceibacterium selenioxidans]